MEALLRLVRDHNAARLRTQPQRLPTWTHVTAFLVPACGPSHAVQVPTDTWEASECSSGGSAAAEEFVTNSCRSKCLLDAAAGLFAAMPDVPTAYKRALTARQGSSAALCRASSLQTVPEHGRLSLEAVFLHDAFDRAEFVDCMQPNASLPGVKGPVLLAASVGLELAALTTARLPRELEEQEGAILHILLDMPDLSWSSKREAALRFVASMVTECYSN